RLPGRLRGDDEALRRQRLLRDDAERFLVVDDEDAGFHPRVASATAGASATSTASSGSRRRNSAPPSVGDVSASMLPPCASMNRREVGSRSPVPFGLVVKNGSIRWLRASDERPGPSSATSMIASLADARSVTSTRLPASIAFFTRFTTTLCTLCAS